jgi:hypothetical protein
VERQVDAFDRAVGVRAPGADEASVGAEAFDGGAERLGAELRAVVGGDLLQGQPAARARPSRTGSDADRGLLPDGALGARQAADEEAVKLDLLGRFGAQAAAGRACVRRRTPERVDRTMLWPLRLETPETNFCT